MYEYEYYDDTESIPAAFFDTDQDSISSLYRTRTWLRVSQWRLGDESYYVGIRKHGVPIALAPMVTFRQPSDYSTTNPHLVASKVLQRDVTETVNYCATLFGIGQPILHSSINLEWEALLGVIRRAAWERTGSKITVIGWFTSFDTIGDLSRRTMYKTPIVPEKSLSVLDLRTFQSFDDFLSSVPSKIRRSYRHDMQSAAQANITFRDTPGIELNSRELGVLATNVMNKYGNHVPPQRIESFIREMSYASDIDCGAVMALYEGKVIGFALYLQADSTLYAHTYGCSYELDTPNPYFGLAYTTLITTALERGASYLNYGAGAGKTKEARGITTVPAYALVSDYV